MDILCVYNVGCLVLWGIWTEKNGVNKITLAFIHRLLFKVNSQPRTGKYQFGEKALLQMGYHSNAFTFVAMRTMFSVHFCGFMKTYDLFLAKSAQLNVSE